MFGKYALPSDDLAGTATTVVASAEDAGYPALNLIAPSNTGHLNLPSRPAKLTTTSGYWDLTFGSAITVVAAAIVYHNFDEGLDVTLEPGAGSIAIPIPAKPGDDDDWTLSPWVEFNATTDTVWRLSVNGANSQAVQVGRLLLLGELRQLETDVRYGGEEQEGRLFFAHQTEVGIETLYDLFDVRRAFNGQFGFRPSETDALRALWRSARNRITPWLLIPDEDVNDAWFVRFEDDAYSRTAETVGFNTHPFRVRELSRGLVWP
jgi:hypothetical protein